MQDVLGFLGRVFMSYLSLVRHGQSEWNEKNLFTGWENPGLTEKGLVEAKEAGVNLNNLETWRIHYDQY